MMCVTKYTTITDDTGLYLHYRPDHSIHAKESQLLERSRGVVQLMWMNEGIL